jgi:hypothetical protein
VTGSAPTRVSAGGLRGAAGSLIGYAARIPRGGGLPIADALAVGSRAAGRPEGGGQRRPTRPALTDRSGQRAHPSRIAQVVVEQILHPVRPATFSEIG